MKTDLKRKYFAAMTVFVVFAGLLALGLLLAPQVSWQRAGALPAILPAQVPQPGPGDKMVLGGAYTLPAGDQIDGSLLVLGGVARMESDSTVTGDVVLLGGTLSIDGRVDGDINILGGLLSLGSNAVVDGDINTIGGSVQRDQGAVVKGQVNDNPSGVFPFVFTPGTFRMPWQPEARQDFGLPRLGLSLNPLWDILWVLFRAMIWAVLAAILALFAARPLGRTSKAAVTNPAATGGLGCLTIIVATIVLVILAITICGIPFSLLGAFILTLAWGYGLIALGMEVGRRIAEMFTQDWAPAVSAALGTFVLILVVNAIDLIPCIGWMAPVLVGSIGLGAVLLTRFGSLAYPPGAEAGATGVSAASLPTPMPFEPAPMPPETEIIDLPEDDLPGSALPPAE